MAKMRKLAILLAAAAVALMCAPATAFAAGVNIKTQPEDVEVNYPEGTSFHVEVDNPDMVVSYQWIATDGFKPFVLDGATATTDTLIIPATAQTFGDLQFYCQITDNQGRRITTNPANLDIVNMEQNKPVLYVGEYALEPGDALDLSTTALGEGVVRFDKNGIDVTFEGVYVNTKYPVFDSTLSPSMGIAFDYTYDYGLEYRFHFLGDCVFINPYFDAKYNSGGIIFNVFFACGDDPNKPTLYLDGGTLTLVGGGYQIYADSNLDINLDITTVPNGAVFCDGIRGGSIFVDEGVTLNLGVNGTAIHTEGDLWLQPGSKVEITSVGPHVANGPTTKNVLFIRGSVYASGADMDIHAIGDASQFHVYTNYLAVWYGIYLAGEGSLVMDDSRINILLESIRGVDIFGVNWGGVTGEGETNSVSLENGSILVVSGDLANVMSANGIYMGGLVTVDATSMVQIDLSCDSEVFGIVAERALVVNDGTVNVQVASGDNGKAYGIICGELEANLEAGGSVYVLAAGGLALGADTGVHNEDGSGSGWNPDYAAECIKLGGKAKVATPSDAGVARWAVPNMGEYELVETFFDKADASAPAQEVLISAPAKAAGLGAITGANGSLPSWPLWLVGALAVIGVVVLGVNLIGRKKE